MEVIGVVQEITTPINIYPYCRHDGCKLNILHDDVVECGKCQRTYNLANVEKGMSMTVIVKGYINGYETVVTFFREHIERISKLLGYKSFLDDMTDEKKIKKEIQKMLISKQPRFVMVTQRNAKGYLVVDAKQISLYMEDDVAEEIETDLSTCRLSFFLMLTSTCRKRVG